MQTFLGQPMCAPKLLRGWCDKNRHPFVPWLVELVLHMCSDGETMRCPQFTARREKSKTFKTEALWPTVHCSCCSWNSKWKGQQRNPMIEFLGNKKCRWQGENIMHTGINRLRQSAHRWPMRIWAADKAVQAFLRSILEQQAYCMGWGGVRGVKHWKPIRSKDAAGCEVKY